MQYEDDYALELEKEMEKLKLEEKELDKLLVMEWERKHQYVCEIYQ